MYKPCPTYKQSAEDDFENIYAKITTNESQMKLKTLWKKVKLAIMTNFTFYRMISKIVCSRGVRKRLYAGGFNLNKVGAGLL